MAAVRAHMGEAGFKSATAWTLENNAPARSFYERRGWHLDGATKFHDWGAFPATDVRLPGRHRLNRRCRTVEKRPRSKRAVNARAATAHPDGRTICRP